jgi:hypothetical protein
VDRFVAALAEPWSRRWRGQAAGAALAFWAAGLTVYLLRWPATAFHCQAPMTTAGPWCRLQNPSALAVAAVALVTAILAGSTVLVSAIAPGLLGLLAGEVWPWHGRSAAAFRPALRWLIRRQVDARGRAAAAGRPVSGQPPSVTPGTGARQRAHRALAANAAYGRVDRAAAARMRRYPPNIAFTAPTRIGSAFAAMTERVWRRHGLDLSVCWEAIIAVLPGSARDSLAQESTRLTRRAQNLIWACSSAVWAAFLGPPWAVIGWLAGAAALASLLYGGVRSAAETYCDLIEAIVAVHRRQLYEGLGLALPDSAAAEIVTGAALSAYLSGVAPAELTFSWQTDVRSEAQAVMLAAAQSPGDAPGADPRPEPMTRGA